MADNDSGQLQFSFTTALALYTPDEIYGRLTHDFLLKIKEDRRIERKPIGIHADELAKYINMWANTKPDGGVIVVGMENDGRILAGGTSVSIAHINELEGGGWPR